MAPGFVCGSGESETLCPSIDAVDDEETQAKGEGADNDGQCQEDLHPDGEAS